MGWLFFKKAEKPAEVLAAEEFNKKLSELLSREDYISVKDYSFLIEQFSESNKTFKTISDARLLSTYCKKNRVKPEFVNAFLSSFKNIQSIISAHNKEFIETSMVKQKKYLDGILYNVDRNIVLDEDQRKVILTDEDYCLVIAGAGAGKTTTVAAKVKYLVDKKNIKSDEILVISFTNKAVCELRDKINKALNIPCPITTFHSAGNAILRKKSDEKPNIVEDSFLYNTIRDYFLVKIKDKKLADNLVLFFGSYFDTQYEGTNKREFLNSIIKSDFSTLKGNLNEYSYTYIDRSTKRKVTLNSEIVKSSQEVQIANFLYLNGIEYEYEPSYPYYIYMSKKRYSPDFVIRQSGKEIYLEHFGLSEDGKNDRYTEEEIAKYKKAISDKIRIHQTHGTKLIYTYSKYNDGRSLLDHLTELLRANDIVSNPRSSEEILNKLTLIQENKYISKMVYLICDFIKNFKINGYTEDKFYEFIRVVKSERTKLFLEICRECYLEYQRSLSRNNAVDFQDMINDAARALREVAALKEKLHFKYIIIDEYQDISRQRFDMAKELANVTDAKIIAVGDDWQSIFAFSGSDVTLFTKFCEKMGYGEELKITKTYRNAQEVIDIAGGFIQKNDAQIKKSLISPKHIEDPVIVVSYDDTPKKWNERATEGGPLNKMAHALEYAIGEIVAKHGNRTNILLIGRYNYDGETLSRTGDFEYNAKGSKVHSKKYPQVDITFLTAHSSKGLGYDNVVIINAKDAVYGFPSKIEDDPVMKLVIKQSDELDYAEERRLFYVALTRTKNRVYIIAPEKHPSEFVLELKNEYKNVVLKGELDPEPHGLLANKVCPICGYPLQRRHRKDCAMSLWVCTNEPEVCGFVSNNLAGGKMYIQKCTECVDGYLIVKTKDDHAFLGCTNYTRDGKGCNNTISPQDFDDSTKGDEIMEMEVVGGDVAEKTKNLIIENNTLIVEDESALDVVSARDDGESLSEEDESHIVYFHDKLLNELALKLRSYAQEQAKKEGVVFWKILRRKVINSFCRYLPISKEELYSRHIWLSREKKEKYGEDIVEIIKKFVEENNIKLTHLNEVEVTDDDIVKNDNQAECVDERICLTEITAKKVAELIIYACTAISKVNDFGTTMTVNVLHGSKNQQIINYQLNKLDCYGVLKSIKTRQIFDVVGFLIEENYLYRTQGQYPILRVNTEKSIEEISDADLAVVAEIFASNNVNSKLQSQTNVDRATTVVDEWEVYVDENGILLTDMALLKRLQTLRKKIGDGRGVPYYCIAWNKVLVRLATEKPTTREEFLSINGISDRWFENNGQAFMQEIKNYVEGR